jgi:glycosyltransferase involved in cell wall biosynthesis
MLMSRPRKLLSVGHSYTVALNRRLAHELARASGGAWEVTAVAPRYFHGSRDLRPVTLKVDAPEPCDVVPVRAYLTQRVHVFFYGPRLRSLLAQDADLVHCWEEPFVLAGAQIAAWTPRATPLVFLTAQNLSKRYPPPFNLFESYCVERCAGWMACGRSVVETLVPRGYGRRPYRVMPLGVDLEHFGPDLAAGQATRRGIGWEPAGAPVVGYLGRFVPEKGLQLLMDVLDQLTTPWRALFVGTGPLEPVLRQWAQRYGDRVRLCTGVTHDEVPRYLNAMDVLCAPSQTAPHWREQFGRMLVEAFACGVPVVGSDSGEIPHVVGSAGVVAGEADLAAWTQALGELLDNAASREEWGERGLDCARTRYAWPVIARRYLEFFEEILVGRPPRQRRAPVAGAV